MDVKLERDLLFIETAANWQRCQDKLLEAEMWLDIAYKRLMAAVGNCQSGRWWLWAYQRRN